MRAPALADGRLPGQQRAEILKADLVGKQRQRERADRDTRDVTPTLCSH